MQTIILICEYTYYVVAPVVIFSHLAHKLHPYFAGH
jgi:hypothetical protein